MNELTKGTGIQDSSGWADRLDEECKEIVDQMGGQDNLALLGIFAKTLNALAEEVYRGSPHAVLDKLGKINVPVDLFYLRDALFTHAAWAFRCGIVRERDVQDKFFDELGSYIPGAAKVKVKTSGSHIPDGFVDISGVICPVEVKLNSFDESAKKQLLRYMKKYKSLKGIAVARELSCNLPERIIFVKIEMDAN